MKFLDKIGLYEKVIMDLPMREDEFLHRLKSQDHLAFKGYHSVNGDYYCKINGFNFEIRGIDSYNQAFGTTWPPLVFS